MAGTEGTDVAPWQLPVRPWDWRKARPIDGDPEVVSLFTNRAGPPPVGRTFPGTIEEVGVGRVTYAGLPSPWLVGWHGTVSAGAMAVPIDAALGISAWTANLQHFSSTVSLHLHVVRRLPLGPRGTRSIGEHVGQSGATVVTTSRTEDEAGQVLVHASARNVLVTLPAGSAPPADAAPTGEEPGLDPGDLQPPAADVDELAAMGSAEVLRGQLGGTVPLSPVQQLTGLHVVNMADGRATASIPASPWVANGGGTVQGGVFVLLAELAAEAAVATTLPPGGDAALLDVRVHFVRPVPLDGTDLVAHAAVVHAGRTMAVADVQVVRSDGKPAALCGVTVERSEP